MLDVNTRMTTEPYIVACSLTNTHIHILASSTYVCVCPMTCEPVCVSAEPVACLLVKYCSSLTQSALYNNIMWICWHRIEDYTMQVTGEESYIFGNIELIAFRHIRKYICRKINILLAVVCWVVFCCCRCIVKVEPIHLSVTEKPPIEVERPHQFSVSKTMTSPLRH